ncbi:fructose-bisphosphatase class II [Pseudonocardia humida]|uniref:fructose-bisphosphatase class II n=1 Tax=Pseudonocardia humida TaxID=2800819 RepID=UPI00207CA84E|nr:fructose-bisphosphatase class II [Pseudonocardia humida]
MNSAWAAKWGTTASGERLIPLSANEIRRLLAKLVLAPVTCLDQVLAWSLWRAADGNTRPAPATTDDAVTLCRHEPSAVAVLAGVVDVAAPTEATLGHIARAHGVAVPELTVCILDRARHEQTLVRRVREAGSRIRFLLDGDVAGALMAASPDTNVDLMVGIGGTPEGVLAACALKCTGGTLYGRFHPATTTSAAAPLLLAGAGRGRPARFPGATCRQRARPGPQGSPRQGLARRRVRGVSRRSQGCCRRGPQRAETRLVHYPAAGGVFGRTASPGRDQRRGCQVEFAGADGGKVRVDLGVVGRPGREQLVAHVFYGRRLPPVAGQSAYREEPTSATSTKSAARVAVRYRPAAVTHTHARSRRVPSNTLIDCWCGGANDEGFDLGAARVGAGGQRHGPLGAPR